MAENIPRIRTGHDTGRKGDYNQVDNSGAKYVSSDSDSSCHSTCNDSDNDYAEDINNVLPNNSITKNLCRLGLCFVIGMFMGFVVEKSRIHQAVNIREQFIFKRLTLLRLLASGVSSGMFFLGLTALIPLTSLSFQQACNRFFAKFSDQTIFCSALGGFILGCGITLSASDPLLVWVQLGSHTPNAVYVLAGCLAGTFLYACFRSRYYQQSTPYFTSSSNPWAQSMYFITILPLIVMFGMLVFAFELFIPWEVESRMKGLKYSNKNSFFGQPFWPPYCTGILVGFLQVLIVLVSKNTLAASQSLLTMISLPLINGKIRSKLSYLSEYSSGFLNWWQVIFVLGVASGGHLSACSADTLHTTTGVPLQQAFFGGIMIAVGAHMGGGSIVTHGLTGMSLLSILSFISVSSIFIGGFVAAIILQRYRLLYVL